ncbi:MAG: LysM peptidoglycan-binding domain-containing protein [Candidatus Hydrogenedentes bacterium]|nr:LysM peptidoglycan-binding domain-containing protein [Candidatus Hydrogenedentota bacterium]
MSKRAGQSLTNLLVTFLLGIAIGFSICYAMFCTDREPAPRDAIARRDEAPIEPVPPPAAPEQGAEEPAADKGEHAPFEQAGVAVPAPAPPGGAGEAGEEPEPVESGPAPDAPPEAAAEDAPPEGEAEPDPELAAVAGLDAMRDTWPARRLFVTVRGEKLTDAERALLTELKPGGVVLLGDNCKSADQIKALVAEIKEAVGLGEGIGDAPLIAVDQEGGMVNRLGLEDAPGAAELGAGGDLGAARRVGRVFGEACRERGIGVVFAPVLDVYEPGATAGMESRAFGEDHELVAAMGVAFADGIMAGGALPVGKHYPGHGGVTQNTHDTLAILDQELKAVARAVYPFSEAAEWKIPGIMIGHIAVPAVDPVNPPRPASLSPVLVRDNLRENWGYHGLIITDNITMGAITESRSIEEAAVEALVAGCDMVLVIEFDPARVRAVCRAIEQAVADGTVSSRQLAASEARFGAWQRWLREPGPREQATFEGEVKVAAAAPPRPPKSDAEPEAAPAGPPDTKPVEYEVKRGDVLSRIAAKFGVRTRDLVAWNDLPDDNVKWGTTLTVYVPEDAAEEAPAAPEEAPKAPEPPEAVPPEAAPEAPPEEAPAAAPAAEEPPVEEPEVAEAEPADEPVVPPPNTRAEEYTIQRGDSLGRIAGKFQVKASDIVAWNGLKDADDIKWGRKLTIYVPEATGGEEEQDQAGAGDAGAEDAGTGDAGTGDAGTGDAGAEDAGTGDAGAEDASADDADEASTDEGAPAEE